MPLAHFECATSTLRMCYKHNIKVQVAHFECALAHLQMYCFSQLGDSEVAHLNHVRNYN